MNSTVHLTLPSSILGVRFRADLQRTRALFDPAGQNVLRSIRVAKAGAARVIARLNRHFLDHRLFASKEYNFTQTSQVEQTIVLRSQCRDLLPDLQEVLPKYHYLEVDIPAQMLMTGVATNTCAMIVAENR